MNARHEKDVFDSVEEDEGDCQTLSPLSDDVEEIATLSPVNNEIDEGTSPPRKHDEKIGEAVILKELLVMTSVEAQGPDSEDEAISPPLFHDDKGINDDNYDDDDGREEYDGDHEKYDGDQENGDHEKYDGGPEEYDGEGSGIKTWEGEPTISASPKITVVGEKETRTGTDVVLRPPGKKRKEKIVLRIPKKAEKREPIYKEKIKKKTSIAKPGDFSEMKIPSVIYDENRWLTYPEENGIMTYISLEKATRHYRKKLGKIGFLMTLATILFGLSSILLIISIIFSWQMWALVPLGVSILFFLTMFLMRMTLKPDKVISLMKNYYRVDILPFTENCSVIYDHHDSVSDFTFHHTDYPFEGIENRLRKISGTPKNIHDEENVISVIAKCADIWNSKKKDVFEVPVAYRNSLLYGGVKELLPYSIIVSHEDTEGTVKEWELPTRWSTDRSIEMNGLLLHFCGLLGTVKEFDNLRKKIELRTSPYEARLQENKDNTSNYYTRLDEMTRDMIGIGDLSDMTDEEFIINPDLPGDNPVFPLQNIIDQFENETRVKREIITEKHENHISKYNEKRSAKIERIREEFRERGDEIGFQMEEIELDTNSLEKELGHIEKHIGDHQERHSGISSGDVAMEETVGREIERLGREKDRCRDKLESNERKLALLAKRRDEITENRTNKIEQVRKDYSTKIKRIVDDRELELGEIRKEVRILAEFRDGILRTAKDSARKIKVLGKEEKGVFEDRSKDMDKIKKYLIKSIENDKKELQQGIKPTDDLRFSYEAALPISFLFPFWSMEYGTGENAVFLPMALKKEGASGGSRFDMCPAHENYFEPFYPGQEKLERFLAQRVRSDAEFFPDRRLVISPDDMKGFEGVFFTGKFLKMIERTERYLW